MRECHKCGACCKYVTVMLDDPEEKVDWEEMRWFLAHNNVKIYKEDGEWYVEFKSPCKYLIDNKCAIYDKRPDVCKDHDPSECDSIDEPFDYELDFETLEEFDAWLKKTSPKTYKEKEE